MLSKVVGQSCIAKLYCKAVLQSCPATLSGKFVFRVNLAHAFTNGYHAGSWLANACVKLANFCARLGNTCVKLANIWDKQASNAKKLQVLGQCAHLVRV